MGTNSPFAVLQEYDQRCRANALGLPVGEIVEDDWVGIGFSLNGKQLVAKMDDVTEILPPPETIRVPGVQAWVKG
ncbi:MAG: chemotaxis protein CheW, partial [Gammaproteobacteria bacterium]|nr:chemotaxis protein CheW [Gammaproteobacteria bacterium]